MRVLVVDNQRRARQSMKALLSAWHTFGDIYEAESGIEAVRLAQEYMPNLILMDARMPNMSGVEALKIIKVKHPHIKVIVLSMYPDIKNEALEAGADAFISKGDPPEVLHEVLAKIMGIS